MVLYAATLPPEKVFTNRPRHSGAKMKYVADTALMKTAGTAVSQ